jgi:hypothetical protein
MDTSLAYRCQLLEERARICEAIHHELALEELNRTNSRREAWARLVIGLKPFPIWRRH